MPAGCQVPHGRPKSSAKINFRCERRARDSPPRENPGVGRGAESDETPFPAIPTAPSGVIWPTGSYRHTVVLALNQGLHLIAGRYRAPALRCYLDPVFGGRSGGTGCKILRRSGVSRSSNAGEYSNPYRVDPHSGPYR